ncbi:error-prone DNA polymerase [Rhodoferax sp. AJA081-3]|uniref:error-prone DNA polymerase n=1 Tax=Rhodoferax sp. AJA081-3 TaxID=2752316 RepID=UPI001ADFCD62|nr:error-prone DNA polymerase [Rhodoferax sp. AJA081-3]QTN27502.1 error-prone DNA polymerase [Rhodoferax sp. AJA081-3]
MQPYLPLAYAELHCLSSFSFQRGASQPEELVQRAAALGYSALAITDECSVAGVVRAHVALRELNADVKGNLKLLLGAEFSVALGPGLDFTAVVLVHNLQGWGNLCQFITVARRAAPKGQYQVGWQGAANQALWAQLSHCEVLLVFQDAMNIEAAYSISAGARGLFGSSLWLAAAFHLGPDDALRRVRLQQLSALSGVPIVATGGVRMHVRSRKPLHDVMTAVRLGQPVAQCGFALQANAERHLRSCARLAALYPAEWLANTLVVAGKCNFDLMEIAYHYPMEPVLPGHTPAQTLRQYCEEGARQRYPTGMPQDIRQRVEHELALISELRFEMYFLTVHDIVRFARSVGILCQGRGSAANSVVCYCLHITEANPQETSLMFERFISRERNEPPDIDVDFEHQRREEVIQYIYNKYGRERAAIAATVISYRPRSALRDVGHALDIPEALITELSKEHPGMYNREVLVERLQSAVDQLDPDCVPPPLDRLELWMSLAIQLQGFPRHLSQHVGGFVLTQGPLTRLVPVENAAMKDRSIIQWDKDDLQAVRLMKVDVLALGMLSAIRRCLELVTQRRQMPRPMTLQDIPREDVPTYDMICKADTVGVFQIESRAQMSMLPRLRPRTYYDLVVQVAIVRPGPIQGGMVHPYLKARNNPELAQSPYPALRKALGRTHGVPIFQEQVMQIAVLAADFTPGEADDLRRSMAAWKRHGNVSQYHDRLVNGMLKNDYPLEFAEAIFRQMEGFGEYGFPESHAASFAILVYFSCWFKWHEPACFLVALLNSQPLGFYGPSQLVQDAQRHGVEVRPVDVSHSDWDCTLECMGSDHRTAQQGVCSDPICSSPGQPAVRLGLRMVSGLRKDVGERIAAERVQHAFTNTQDLALRCGLNELDLKALASADALLSLSGHRRQQVWDASALKPAPVLLQGIPIDEDELLLPAAAEGEEVVFDYASVGLTLRSHPLALMRGELAKKKLLTATQLATLPHGRLVRACGLVTMRQRPQTAKGVIFITLEDETGSVNVIVWKAVRERFRQEVYRSRLLMVYGEWQRDEESGGNVRHVIAKTLVDLTPMLGDLATTSRDFH